MQKLKQGFKKIPLILVFILALVVVFSLKTKQYLTYRNLLVLLQQGSVLLIVASSATFIIISGGLDLSLGAILTLSGITAALAVTAGVPIPFVFVVGALTGAVCGLLNGWLISCCGLPPFITTLGTQGIFYGIALVLTNKEGIVIYDEAFLTIGATLYRAVDAAKTLSEKYGVEADVINMPSLVPLDYTDLIASVKKTGRVVLASDACARGTFLNEIAENLTNMCFDYLDAPPVVIGARNWITPPHEFDKYFFPYAEWIIDAVNARLIPLEGYTSTTTPDEAEIIRRNKLGV